MNSNSSNTSAGMGARRCGAGRRRWLSSGRGIRVPRLLVVRRGGCRRRDPESATNDRSGQVEHAGVVAKDEAGVGGEDDAVQFEGEDVRVLVGGQLVMLDGGDDELTDHGRESALKGRDVVL